MKLVKTASGKRIEISKKEWQSIGKQAGWTSQTKTAESDDYREFMDRLEKDNPSKIKPVIQLTESDGILLPKSEFDRKKLDLILGKHEFNALPETVMALDQKLWEGTSEHKFDWNTGYSFLIDGKGPRRYLAEKEETQAEGTEPS